MGETSVHSVIRTNLVHSLMAGVFVVSCAQTDVENRLTAPAPQGAPHAGAENGDPVRVTLALREVVVAAGLSLRWTELEEDSRCAIGVRCIWEGRVVILLEVGAGNGDSQEVRLTDHPDGLREGERTPGELAERVTLLQVEPRPHADTAIDESDYRATIEVRSGKADASIP